MYTSEYRRGVIELFKSGQATRAQEDEMVAAVLAASETGLHLVENIHAGIGFPAEVAA